MDNFQKNLDVLEFSDSYFSNSVKILLVCQVLKVSTALNHILILPVYFLFYKTIRLYRIIKNQGFIFEKYQNAHEDSNFRKTFDFKQISYG